MQFRARLCEAGLHDVIFDAVVRHIERQGLRVKEGTMVDATIIEAPRGRPRPDGTTTRDQEASFTSKHRVPHHGSRGHIAADLSGIVTGCRFGTTKEHDSRDIDEMTIRKKTLGLADRAYADRARRAALWSRGVIDAGSAPSATAGRSSSPTGRSAGTGWCQEPDAGRAPDGADEAATRLPQGAVAESRT